MFCFPTSLSPYQSYLLYPIWCFSPILVFRISKKHLAVPFVLTDLLGFFLKLLTCFKRKKPQPGETLVSSYICILVAVSRFMQSILQCREILLHKDDFFCPKEMCVCVNFWLFLQLQK